MTRRELAVRLIQDSLKDAVMGDMFKLYESYAEFIREEYEGSGKAFKDDEVVWNLMDYGNKHPELGQWYTDDCEIIEEDGTIISYRKWSADIRKLWDDDSDEVIEEAI
ncbi:MAG: hypothetical protein WC992_07695 [Acholeplasmataceae bacterium]